MIVSHLDRPRFTKIAEADPALAIELVAIDPELGGLLPDHMRRDLCLIDTLPAGSTSLADLVLKGRNPLPRRASTTTIRGSGAEDSSQGAVWHRGARRPRSDDP